MNEQGRVGRVNDPRYRCLCPRGVWRKALWRMIASFGPRRVVPCLYLSMRCYYDVRDHPGVAGLTAFTRRRVLRP